MSIAATRRPFGTLSDGGAVEAVELIGEGISVRLIGFGAAIQSLYVPDRDGRMADVVLGYPDLGLYETRPLYLGATIGRYANRIAHGRFEIDGRLVQLACNNGANSLHGGPGGFHHRNWTIAALGDDPVPSVTFERVSPDGEEGFPGTVTASVRYALTAPGELTIAFEAETDAPTIVNLTNHSFFNLAGTERLQAILDHRLTVDADAYLPIDAGSIPTGEVRSVEGTAFDFRSGRAFGEHIHDGADPQIAAARGYDHNYVLNAGGSIEPVFAARVEDPASGRVMELHTTEPGLQVYSGNFLDASTVGKYGQVQRQSDAFCLEPQHFPDSPNRPEFPSVRLEPGARYRHTSIYRFTT
ncbi:aldose epimerase family protein [Mangrovibrevibacter kandeliae]|uniref:aldose epimerase family protein n=1 Tax=Mangrovibrevibacter kandeliae TaxID=2968473 RepID=UPI002118C34C|nr:aldose epimerase family protein [Aurantimonas sp. CSK15Z-1]MCQ8783380.1 galactose mutarotase [Aurantimonas sp. CSK15Z-1]